MKTNNKSTTGIIPKSQIADAMTSAVMVGKSEFSTNSNVQVVQNGKQIEYIDVTCDCGKVTRIYCDYEEQKKVG